MLMPMMKAILLGALSFFLFHTPSFGFQCAAPDGPCAGSTPGTQAWHTHALLNNQVVSVDFDSAPGEGCTTWSGPVQGMPMRCVCGMNHKTRCNRGFIHSHNEIAIPATGRMATVWTYPGDGYIGRRVVTPAMIEAYWDWEYLQDGFQRVDGTTFDPSMNCYGYAMGLNTFFRGMIEVILQDDWDGGTSNFRDVTLELSSDGHAASVTYVNFPLPMGPGFTPRRVKVLEKFYDSPIYEKADEHGNLFPKQVLHRDASGIGWGTLYARHGIANVPPPGYP